MAKQTKKQHFVPRTYYKNFCLDESEQLFAYDKENKTSFKSNIRDITQGRYFNDIDIADILLPELKQSITEKEKVVVDRINDSQWIENNLANIVEVDMDKMLQKVLNRVNSLTPWEERNCKCFTHDEKLGFSIHLAIQTIRTKQQRDMITDSARITNRVYKDACELFGSPVIEENKYQHSDKEAKNTHLMMLLDADPIIEMASIYANFLWVLIINDTNKPFYTSDHPIANIPHSKKNIFSNNGLLSEGIEVFYPLSNSAALTMFDGEFHKWLGDRDCFFRKGISEKAVSDYNKCIILSSNRFVYSTDEGFVDVRELLDWDPDAFDYPKMVAYFGGKEYVP